VIRKGFARAVIVLAVTCVALTGNGMVTAARAQGAAHSHGTDSRAAEAAAQPTAKCIAAKKHVTSVKHKVKTDKKKVHKDGKKVKKAKKAAKKAHGKAGKKRASSKVHKATKKLHKAKKALKSAHKKLQKATKHRKSACKTSQQEQDSNDVTNILLQLSDILGSNGLAELPPALGDLLAQVLQSVADLVTSLADAIPNADTTQLDAITAELQSIEPSQLSDLITQLQSALTGIGDPTAVTSLLEGLTSSLPTGTTLPTGDLSDLAAQFTALTSALSNFDPSNPGASIGAIGDAGTALSDALVSGTGSLSDLLTELTGLLTGGDLSSLTPADFGNLIASITSGGTTGSLPFSLSALNISQFQDLYNTLSSALGGGSSIPSLTTLLDNLGLGDLLGLLGL
jgi:hypothetical protein